MPGLAQRTQKSRRPIGGEAQLSIWGYKGLMKVVVVMMFVVVIVVVVEVLMVVGVGTITGISGVNN